MAKVAQNIDLKDDAEFRGELLRILGLIHETLQRMVPPPNRQSGYQRPNP